MERNLRTSLMAFLWFGALSIGLHASPKKIADVIVNDEIVPLGMLEPALNARGYEINLIKAQNLNIADVLSKDADLLIVLGGRQSVTRLHENPYFFDEMALMRSREARGKATLGLCLGAQLMALAFGGKVEKGPVVEQGWIELQPTAMTDENTPVRELIASRTRVYASHEDAIVGLPEQAVLLARSNLYDHIFLIGKNSMAIQFHPEATPEITRNWLDLFGGSPEIILSKQQENEKVFSENKFGLEQFWENWLDWASNNLPADTL